MAHGGQAQIWKSSGVDTLTTVHNFSVNKLAYGENHCVFITSSGRIFAYGEGDKGQLGTGSQSNHVKEPVPVKLSQCCDDGVCDDCAVVDVDCGPSNAAAITKNGAVYMWGCSDKGQCGVEESFVLKPRHVEIVNALENTSPSNICDLHSGDKDSYQVPIVQVACGNEHTVALSTSHEVWVWGTGSAHLGLIGVLWTYKPLKLQFLELKKVLAVSCGFDHTAVIVQKSNVSDDDKERKKECIKCQLNKSLLSNLSIESKTCPLGLPVVDPTIDQENKNITEDQEEMTVKFEECNISNDESQVCASEVQLSLKEELDNACSSSKNYEKSNIEVSADPAETDCEIEECKIATEHSLPSSMTSSLIDKESAETFLSKKQLEFGMQAEEVKSMKETVLAATSHVVTELCNTVSEKLEMLVQMKALPTEGKGSGIEEDFIDITEEANLLFPKGDDSVTLSVRSSSLEILEESKLLKNSYDRTSSSMDKLLLDNKNKYRSYSRSKSTDKFTRESSRNSLNSLKSGTQTELWTWGKGRHGQLGHGDMLERQQPCNVQSLSNKNVIKVIASGNHTVAMTSDCRIFSWGNNTYKQLGHSSTLPSVCSPTRIQISGSTLVWDIAANNYCTIFLADGPGKQVGVYSCGGHTSRSEESNISLSSVSPIRLDFLKKDVRISRIYAGGEFCGYISEIQSSNSAKLLHDFAVAEKQFNYIMKMVSEEILKSLLREDAMNQDSTCVTALKVLIGLHTELCDAVAINCFDLVQLLQDGSYVFATCGILEVYMVDEADEYLNLINHFINAFFDCIAVGAFTYVVKLASSFFDQKRPILNEIYQMTSPKNRTTNMAMIFTNLLELGCHHISKYVHYMSKFSLHYKQGSSEQTLLEEISNKYASCNASLKKKSTSAEKTYKFWETCPAKLAEALKELERRFIKDSKSHSLTLYGGSRFTYHWFMFFNDVFIHSQFSGIQAYYLATIWVDVLPDSETYMNSFSLTTPEEVLILSCPSAELKTEWVCSLNEAVKNALSNSASNQKEHRISPPLARFASHTFVKPGAYKDATYTGMWLCGKLHGEGRIEWTNGKSYVGKFKQNLQHGHGILTVPSDVVNSGFITYEGEWKNGLLNGLGTVKYPNGDLYEGYFKDDLRHGHGVLKKGQFLSTAASVYIGQWANNVRNGYGVNDDVMAGEKYLGWWENDVRHGTGIVVTIDGVYYEGVFNHNKMQGYGLVIFEDNTNYEGDLSGHGIFNGKGTLNLSNGDHIEGTFNGKWNDGVKVNGVFHKSSSSSMTVMQSRHVLPKSFGKLCVPVEKKWDNIFQQCSEMLGIVDATSYRNKETTSKAWENVAITVTNWKKILQQKHVKKIKQKLNNNLHDLDTIPKQSSLASDSPLYNEDFQEIKSYLSRAFDCIYHPVGQMIDQLVDVFRATYIGVGAHPKLLIHAVEEVRSYISRIYLLIRILYPVLPKADENKLIRIANQPSLCDAEESLDNDDSPNDIVTPLSLLLPLLLPRIYSPLFMLYALDNEYSDEKYWERLLKWNKQSDVILLNFLGADQKFWLDDLEMLTDKHQSAPGAREMFFCDSIETLQRLSTTFSPLEKLQVIHQTFQEINKAVEKHLGQSVLWTMDELFPVFQFTVVRSRIRHLGSEINFIDDFMEKRLEHGELGLMFTTLKACYFQIQNEKVVNW